MDNTRFTWLTSLIFGLMVPINDFIKGFSNAIPGIGDKAPWEITRMLPGIVNDIILRLGNEYKIKDEIAIHRSATIQQGVLLNGPIIIGENCFIGANACLRAGVFLGESVTVGTGCEVKSSVIFNNSAIAHFNFIGDSLIGSGVNFEAGSMAANHFNERLDKRISVSYNSSVIDTASDKFGALVSDGCKIGANAVLSPGTILAPGSIIKRLELVEQVKG